MSAGGAKSPITDSDWLPKLADEINAEHAAAEESARDAVSRAYRAGKLLVKAKQRVGHGNWLGWIDENLTLSKRTAQAYMRVASKLPTLPAQQAEHVKGLTLAEMVLLLREPREQGKAGKCAVTAHLEPEASDDATPNDPPSTDASVMPRGEAPVSPKTQMATPSPPDESSETSEIGGSVSVVLERMARVFSANLEDDAPLWEEWGRLSEEDKRKALSAIYSRIERVVELHRRLNGDT